jgi:hypothetical protein
MKKLLILTLMLALGAYVFGQKRDLNKYVGDTVVVKKTYMPGYEGFYKSLRPTPKTTEEIMASLKINRLNDSTILFNDGTGRTPAKRLSGERFFCTKLTTEDRYSYLELQNSKYGTLYYRVSDYGDFVLNTLEKQKESDKFDNELEKIKKESEQRRIESKALLSQLTYGSDNKYHYKKTVKVAGAQTQGLLSKTKIFFKDFTQSTEGPTWRQVAGTNKVVGSVAVGRDLLMDVTIQSNLGQYTYDISHVEFQTKGIWDPAEIVLSSTDNIFDEKKTDILAGILYVSQEIEKKIK